MPVGLLKDIVHDIPCDVRLLGMDTGTKTIGLAICDPAHQVVTPLKTIKRSKFTKDIKILAHIIEDYEIGGYIIGFPLHMDNTEGRRCQSVRDFAAELIRYPDIVGEDPWIALHDERLSTETVEAFVDKSLDIPHRKAKNRGITDQLAAVHILDSALRIINGFKE